MTDRDDYKALLRAVCAAPGDEEYLRLHGRGEWHRVAFAPGALPGGHRRDIMLRLLAAEFGAGITFHLPPAAGYFHDVVVRDIRVTR